MFTFGQTGVGTGQLSSTCSGQCFQLQKRLMSASAMEKNHSNNNNNNKQHWFSYLHL